MNSNINNGSGGALKTGNSIKFTYCPGVITVVSIVGTQKMTCREVESRLYTGPVTIRTLRCSQNFEFERTCDEKLSAGYVTSSCTNSTITIAFIIQSVIAVILILALILTLMVVTRINKGIKTSEGYIPMTREGRSYVIDFEEWIDENGDKNTRGLKKESIMNVVRKQKRLTIARIILLTILCRPMNVSSYEIVGSYDSTLMKYSYLIDLVDQEVIDLGSSSIIREPVHHSGQLTKMFDTADWTIHHEEQYFYQWYKCEAYSAFGASALPFIKSGPLAQSLFNYSNPQNAYYTCQKILAYCMFGNGCKLMSIEVIPKETSRYSIYSISKGGSFGGNVKVPPGCVMENLVDNSAGELQNFYLVSDNKETHFLCSYELLSLKPEGGMLGDLQIGPNNVSRFMTNEIICTANWGDRAICRYPSPFIKSLSRVCHKPSDLGLTMKINTDVNHISWLLPGSARLTMRCDRELPLRTTRQLCEDVSIKVWEIAHLDASMTLSFSARATSDTADFKFPSSVHIKTKLFKCDGKTYFTEVYDLKSLESSGLNFTHNLLPYEEIDNPARRTMRERGLFFL